MQAKVNSLLLRTIAAFKFSKSVLLVIAGIGVLRVANKNLGDYADSLVFRFHLNPGNHFIGHFLARAANVTPRQLHDLGIVSFVYAGLFLLEGVGLWTLKRWGEWITVIITGSLLPFELYEVWRKPSLIRSGVLLLNAVVVWYLARRLHKD